MEKAIWPMTRGLQTIHCPRLKISASKPGCQVIDLTSMPFLTRFGAEAGQLPPFVAQRALCATKGGSCPASAPNLVKNGMDVRSITWQPGFHAENLQPWAVNRL